MPLEPIPLSWILSNLHMKMAKEADKNGCTLWEGGRWPSGHGRYDNKYVHSYYVQIVGKTNAFDEGYYEVDGRVKCCPHSKLCCNDRHLTFKKKGDPCPK